MDVSPIVAAVGLGVTVCSALVAIGNALGKREASRDLATREVVLPPPPPSPRASVHDVEIEALRARVSAIELREERAATAREATAQTMGRILAILEERARAREERGSGRRDS